MAHIQKRLRRQRDGSTQITWRARYRDPSGRERSKTFARKADAERYLAGVETSKAKGEWIDPALGRTQLGEWASEWLSAKRRLKPKTRAGYESLLASRIRPEFGDVPLNRIRRIDVERWVSAMVGEGLSASRVRQAHQCLSAVLKAAVQNGYIGRNPAAGVELPRRQAKERRFLSAGEVAELAEVMPDRYRALVYVLTYGGLRFGEAVALRRRRCDLLHRRLEIAEAATEVNGELMWGAPKTHQCGSVSLPRFVTTILSEHLERAVAADPDALVFTTERGTPLRHSNFLANVWRPALALTSLPQDLTPHELRHTCAALLIAKGADPKAIQAQMRHSSIAVTFDVYGHLFPGHLDDVLDQLEDDHHRALETEPPQIPHLYPPKTSW